MEKKLITMVQFQSVYEHKYWEPDLYSMYFVSEINSREDFDDTFEDDEGNEVEDIITKRCIRIHRSYDDMINCDDEACIPMDESDYTLLTIPVTVNNDNEIVGLINKKTA